jgi:hypothetical protein
MRMLVIVALALCAFSSQVQAGCTCQCVNGQMQPLCSSALRRSLSPRSFPQAHFSSPREPHIAG